MSSVKGVSHHNTTIDVNESEINITDTSITVNEGLLQVNKYFGHPDGFNGGQINLGMRTTIVDHMTSENGFLIDLPYEGSKATFRTHDGNARYDTVIQPNGVLQLNTYFGHPDGYNGGQINLGFRARIIDHMKSAESFLIDLDYAGSKVRFKTKESGGTGHETVITPEGDLELDGAVHPCYGADLAEVFSVSDVEKIAPGMVLAIDHKRAGKLRLADRCYDRAVAGVVSGAGNQKPGMVLAAGDSHAPDSHEVALSGRVYVWADASSSDIWPGDLLTTSGNPGHAMKVTDHSRAQGAILGKAMSELTEGTGLVLALVSLQ